MTGIWQLVLYALLTVGSLLTGFYIILAVIRGFQLQVLEIQLRRQVALKNYPLALATLQKTFRLNPSHADIYFQRAKIYAALGDFDSAEADFTAGLKFTPNAPAYAGRAAARLALGRPGEALVDANHVIACSRLWWRGYYERGRVYHALGYFQIALDDFDQAFSLNRQAQADILAARTEAAGRLEQGQEITGRQGILPRHST
jgi:tetratricopeptide (TPR) repeat protein